MTDPHKPTTVVLASANRGKLEELQQLVGDAVHVVSAPALGITMPEETGTTFAENAALKADAAFDQTGHISLADDSGLEVDALDGRPGVYSARFAGEDASDTENNEKLLAELSDVPEGLRSARFRSAIAIRFDSDTLLIFEGACEGFVGFESRGSGGFGYDPLFYLPNGRTMAELGPGEKNAVSHRGEAMRKAVPVLLEHLGRRAGRS
jgi:XTP/dITP diphosphohydrolase